MQQKHSFSIQYKDPKKEYESGNMDTLQFDVSLGETILQLKQKIHEKTGIPINAQTLFFKNELCENDKLVSDYRNQIKDGDREFECRCALIIDNRKASRLNARKDLNLSLNSKDGVRTQIGSVVSLIALDIIPSDAEKEKILREKINFPFIDLSIQDGMTFYFKDKEYRDKFFWALKNAGYEPNPDFNSSYDNDKFGTFPYSVRLNNHKNVIKFIEEGCGLVSHPQTGVGASNQYLRDLYVQVPEMRYTAPEARGHYLNNVFARLGINTNTAEVEKKKLLWLAIKKIDTKNARGHDIASDDLVHLFYTDVEAGLKIAFADYFERIQELELQLKNLLANDNDKLEEIRRFKNTKEIAGSAENLNFNNDLSWVDNYVSYDNYLKVNIQNAIENHQYDDYTEYQMRKDLYVALIEVPEKILKDNGYVGHENLNLLCNRFNHVCDSYEKEICILLEKTAKTPKKTFENIFENTRKKKIDYHSDFPFSKQDISDHLSYLSALQKKHRELMADYREKIKAKAAVYIHKLKINDLVLQFQKIGSNSLKKIKPIDGSRIMTTDPDFLNNLIDYCDDCGSHEKFLDGIIPEFDALWPGLKKEIEVILQIEKIQKINALVQEAFAYKPIALESNYLLKKAFDLKFVNAAGFFQGRKTLSDNFDDENIDQIRHFLSFYSVDYRFQADSIIEELKKYISGKKKEFENEKKRYYKDLEAANIGYSKSLFSDSINVGVQKFFTIVAPIENALKLINAKVRVSFSEIPDVSNIDKRFAEINNFQLLQALAEPLSVYLNENKNTSEPHPLEIQKLIDCLQNEMHNVEDLDTQVLQKAKTYLESDEYKNLRKTRIDTAALENQKPLRAIINEACDLSDLLWAYDASFGISKSSVRPMLNESIELSRVLLKTLDRRDIPNKNYKGVLVDSKGKVIRVDNQNPKKDPCLISANNYLNYLRDVHNKCVIDNQKRYIDEKHRFDACMTGFKENPIFSEFVHVKKAFGKIHDEIKNANSIEKLNAAYLAGFYAYVEEIACLRDLYDLFNKRLAVLKKLDVDISAYQKIQNIDALEKANKKMRAEINQKMGDYLEEIYGYQEVYEDAKTALESAKASLKDFISQKHTSPDFSWLVEIQLILDEIKNNPICNLTEFAEFNDVCWKQETRDDAHNQMLAFIALRDKLAAENKDDAIAKKTDKLLKEVENYKKQREEEKARRNISNPHAEMAKEKLRGLLLSFADRLHIDKSILNNKEVSIESLRKLFDSHFMSVVNNVHRLCDKNDRERFENEKILFYWRDYDLLHVEDIEKKGELLEKFYQRQSELLAGYKNKLEQKLKKIKSVPYLREKYDNQFYVGSRFRGQEENEARLTVDRITTLQRVLAINNVSEVLDLDEKEIDKEIVIFERYWKQIKLGIETSLASKEIVCITELIAEAYRYGEVIRPDDVHLRFLSLFDKTIVSPAGFFNGRKTLSDNYHDEIPMQIEHYTNFLSHVRGDVLKKQTIPALEKLIKKQEKNFEVEKKNYYAALKTADIGFSKVFGFEKIDVDQNKWLSFFSPIIKVFQQMKCILQFHFIFGDIPVPENLRQLETQLKNFLILVDLTSSLNEYLIDNKIPSRFTPAPIQALIDHLQNKSIAVSDMDTLILENAKTYFKSDDYKDYKDAKRASSIAQIQFQEAKKNLESYGKQLNKDLLFCSFEVDSKEFPEIEEKIKNAKTYKALGDAYLEGEKSFNDRRELLEKKYTTLQIYQKVMVKLEKEWRFYYNEESQLDNNLKKFREQINEFVSTSIDKLSAYYKKYEEAKTRLTEAFLSIRGLSSEKISPPSRSLLEEAQDVLNKILHVHIAFNFRRYVNDVSHDFSKNMIDFIELVETLEKSEKEKSMTDKVNALIEEINTYKLQCEKEKAELKEKTAELEKAQKPLDDLLLQIYNLFDFYERNFPAKKGEKPDEFHKLFWKNNPQTLFVSLAEEYPPSKNVKNFSLITCRGNANFIRYYNSDYYPGSLDHLQPAMDKIKTFLNDCQVFTVDMFKKKVGDVKERQVYLLGLKEQLQTWNLWEAHQEAVENFSAVEFPEDNFAKVFDLEEIKKWMEKFNANKNILSNIESAVFNSIKTKGFSVIGNDSVGWNTLIQQHEVQEFEANSNKSKAIKALLDFIADFEAKKAQEKLIQEAEIAQEKADREEKERQAKLAQAAQAPLREIFKQINEVVLFIHDEIPFNFEKFTTINASDVKKIYKDAFNVERETYDMSHHKEVFYIDDNRLVCADKLSDVTITANNYLERGRRYIEMRGVQDKIKILDESKASLNKHKENLQKWELWKAVEQSMTLWLLEEDEPIVSKFYAAPADLSHAKICVNYLNEKLNKLHAFELDLISKILAKAAASVVGQTNEMFSANILEINAQYEEECAALKPLEGDESREALIKKAHIFEKMGKRLTTLKRCLSLVTAIQDQAEIDRLAKEKAELEAKERERERQDRLALEAKEKAELEEKERQAKLAQAEKEAKEAAEKALGEKNVEGAAIQELGMAKTKLATEIQHTRKILPHFSIKKDIITCAQNDVQAAQTHEDKIKACKKHQAIFETTQKNLAEQVNTFQKLDALSAIHKDNIANLEQLENAIGESKKQLKAKVEVISENVKKLKTLYQKQSNLIETQKTALEAQPFALPKLEGSNQTAVDSLDAEIITATKLFETTETAVLLLPESPEEWSKSDWEAMQKLEKQLQPVIDQDFADKVEKTIKNAESYIREQSHIHQEKINELNKYAEIKKSVEERFSNCKAALENAAQLKPNQENKVEEVFSEDVGLYNEISVALEADVKTLSKEEISLKQTVLQQKIDLFESKQPLWKEIEKAKETLKQSKQDYQDSTGEEVSVTTLWVESQEKPATKEAYLEKIKQQINNVKSSTSQAVQEKTAALNHKRSEKLAALKKQIDLVQQKQTALETERHTLQQSNSTSNQVAKQLFTLEEQIKKLQEKSTGLTAAQSTLEKEITPASALESDKIFEKANTALKNVSQVVTAADAAIGVSQQLSKAEKSSSLKQKLLAALNLAKTYQLFLNQSLVKFSVQEKNIFASHIAAFTAAIDDCAKLNDKEHDLSVIEEKQKILEEKVKAWNEVLLAKDARVEAEKSYHQFFGEETKPIFTKPKKPIATLEEKLIYYKEQTNEIPGLIQQGRTDRHQALEERKTKAQKAIDKKIGELLEFIREKNPGQISDLLLSLNCQYSVINKAASALQTANENLNAVIKKLREIKFHLETPVELSAITTIKFTPDFFETVKKEYDAALIESKKAEKALDDQIIVCQSVIKNDKEKKTQIKNMIQAVFKDEKNLSGLIKQPISLDFSEEDFAILDVLRKKWFPTSKGDVALNKEDIDAAVHQLTQNYYSALDNKQPEADIAGLLKTDLLAYQAAVNIARENSIIAKKLYVEKALALYDGLKGYGDVPPNAEMLDIRRALFLPESGNWNHEDNVDPRSNFFKDAVEKMAAKPASQRLPLDVLIQKINRYKRLAKENREIQRIQKDLSHQFHALRKTDPAGKTGLFEQYLKEKSALSAKIKPEGFLAGVASFLASWNIRPLWADEYLSFEETSEKRKAAIKSQAVTLEENVEKLTAYHQARAVLVEARTFRAASEEVAARQRTSLSSWQNISDELEKQLNNSDWESSMNDIQALSVKAEMLEEKYARQKAESKKQKPSQVSLQAISSALNTEEKIFSAPSVQAVFPEVITPNPKREEMIKQLEVHEKNYQTLYDDINNSRYLWTEQHFKVQVFNQVCAQLEQIKALKNALQEAVSDKLIASAKNDAFGKLKVHIQPQHLQMSEKLDSCYRVNVSPNEKTKGFKPYTVIFSSLQGQVHSAFFKKENMNSLNQQLEVFELNTKKINNVMEQHADLKMEHQTGFHEKAKDYTQKITRRGVVKKTGG